MLFFSFIVQPAPASAPGQAAPAPSGYGTLYPSLSDYMGIDVSEEAVRQHVPDYVSDRSG